MSIAARARRARAPPFLDPPGYASHRPEATLLYQLVEQHYPAFRAPGAPLARAVRRGAESDYPSRGHLDIETDDIKAEVRRLESLGACGVAEVHTCCVMEAPTGQRFCVVRKSSLGFYAGANEWR